ncbi:MAG: HAD family phosphatase [Ruminococcus sp.]|nr:HAD family phosphatase [Ruminococcus sp.]
MKFKLDDVRAFVFDMDGVIFDSERLGLRCWQIVADRYDLGDISEIAKKCIGRSTKDTMMIFDQAYGDKVSVENLYTEAKTVMGELIEKEGLPLKSGVFELLGFLKESGIKLGLASSTSYKTVCAELKGAGLLDFFEVVVGGDMIEHSKPEPDIYLLACEKLEVAPVNAACVEDSFNGIISASRAGLHTVMVPDMLIPTDEILKLVEVYKQSLGEVKTYLEDSARE